MLYTIIGWIVTIVVVTVAAIALFRFLLAPRCVPQSYAPIMQKVSDQNCYKQGQHEKIVNSDITNTAILSHSEKPNKVKYNRCQQNGITTRNGLNEQNDGNQTETKLTSNISTALQNNNKSNDTAKEDSETQLEQLMQKPELSSIQTNLDRHSMISGVANPKPQNLMSTLEADVNNGSADESKQ